MGLAANRSKSVMGWLMAVWNGLVVARGGDSAAKDSGGLRRKEGRILIHPRRGGRGGFWGIGRLRVTAVRTIDVFWNLPTLRREAYFAEIV